MVRLDTFGHLKQFKHTHSVRHSTNNDTVLFYHLTSEDNVHYVLVLFCFQSWVILGIESGVILFVSQFSSEKIRHYVSSNLLLDLRYILTLNIDLSIHFVLPI